MDAADRERPPSTPSTVTPKRALRPDAKETAETTEEDSLTVLPADRDPVCESGYGFGV
jgi:hypothetical protein